MSQDNKKSFVMYQGDGSNNVFSVPMTKGKYGTISVAFVRRGLDQYEYNPDTWGLNGGLFAWDSSGTKVYTDTATPAIGATIYDQYGVDTGDTVTAVGGATITVNTDVYTRDTLHDVDENTVLTWTGDTLQIGDYIVIERTTTRTQPFEFQNNQKHVEKSDDNLERQIQEVADKVDNALLVDPTHTIDSNKMNPVEWMKTILRSVDKSVRGFRYLNGWLDYSLDDPNIADVDKTWTHLVNTDNIKAIREQSRIENNETIYYTEYLAQDGSWKTLSDPHKWDNMKLSDLADTDFTNLSAGNFITFDGLKWKNVNYSAVCAWGGITGTLADQTDLQNALDAKVNIDGSSIMTAPLKFASGSMRGAVGPYLNGVSFWKMDSQYTATNIANLTDSRFLPVSTNSIDLGRTANTWKDLYLGGKAYVATLNNGADLTVPNKSGTLATMGDVELAARSGRMLTDQGKWYAKMYSATTVPTGAEYDGRNYADFSQVDQDNNPIIVIYEGQSGAWVQSETITPPAEYDGYVSITSKIWDIVEQSGQQGGRVLWNHTSKEFTPEPRIISTNDIEVTGNSTVIMPYAPSANQIVNKNYVDTLVSNSIGDATITLTQGGQTMGSFTTNQSGDATIALDGGSSSYHPDLFDWKWADHQVNDVQWLRADTWSWQSGAVYEVAFNELFYDIQISTYWYHSGGPAYTKSRTPAVGDAVYLNSDLTTQIGTVEAYDDVNDEITVSGDTYTFMSNTYVTPTTETVAGYSVSVYTGHSGRKIVAASDATAVDNIYTATGVAWYYIIDISGKRFKLPRTKWGITGLRDTVGNYVPESLPNHRHKMFQDNGQNTDITTSSFVSRNRQTGGDSAYILGQKTNNEEPTFGLSGKVDSVSTYQDDAPVQQRATQMYLYFYVGEFTQTAIENTAGLNTGLFNGKADTDLRNVSAGIDFVVESQLPTAGNNYTWYRKYKSGWVEQGGILSAIAHNSNGLYTLPIEMADTSYSARAGCAQVNSSATFAASSTVAAAPGSTTQVRVGQANGGSAAMTVWWEVKGMAA